MMKNGLWLKLFSALSATGIFGQGSHAGMVRNAISRSERVTITRKDSMALQVKIEVGIQGTFLEKGRTTDNVASNCLHNL
jgi:hypothetical protein